ncbi:MAG: type II toxin-antitoxin system VapC family toxin [Candidatus Methanoperedens sp.]|nr:type II toxin-antitoxin system VapC family toxin [Candidatus Methanoperedens sp.]MCZ7371152.1 type II toxin-antitoxin system VapC family toxin [Candidatus Methanoperedens sp.]
MKYKRIGLDTNVLIYYIEEHPFYLRKIEPLVDRISEGKAIGITSYVTLLELLVKPLREKRFDLVEQYKRILAARLEMVAMDESVSIKAAELRAKYGIRTPDAIQLASVITRNGDVFVTNDERLGVVEEIEVLTLGEIPD